MILLNNMFRSTDFSGSKYEIENDELFEYAYRGDRVISESMRDDMGRGFLFSAVDWKESISEINILTRRIFGENFCNPYGYRVNPIALHDRFLDFVDAKRERSPEGFFLFIKRISMNPLLKHFPDILEKEGIIRQT